VCVCVRACMAVYMLMNGLVPDI